MHLYSLEATSAAASVLCVTDGPAFNLGHSPFPHTHTDTHTDFDLWPCSHMQTKFPVWSLAPLFM